MKTLLPAFSLLILMVASASAAPVNVKKGLALEGYDPVAFHTQSAAIKGSDANSFVHEGATYYFSSAENQQLFAANPEKYAPAFGGYCAWAISTKGYLAPVQIDTWQIVDDRLILNFNKSIQKRFNKDLQGNMSKALANWPNVVKANS